MSGRRVNEIMRVKEALCDPSFAEKVTRTVKIALEQFVRNQVMTQISAAIVAADEAGLTDREVRRFIEQILRKNRKTK